MLNLERLKVAQKQKTRLHGAFFNRKPTSVIVIVRGGAQLQEQRTLQRLQHQQTPTKRKAGAGNRIRDFREPSRKRNFRTRRENC